MLLKTCVQDLEEQLQQQEQLGPEQHVLLRSVLRVPPSAACFNLDPEAGSYVRSPADTEVPEAIWTQKQGYMSAVLLTPDCTLP